MQFGKLTLTLKALSAAQLKRLDKFVHSPYFSVYQPSVLVFEELQKLHPHFSETNLSSEAISRWSKKLSTIKQQETAGVRLLRAIEMFIIIEKAKNTLDLPNVNLLEELRHLKLTAEFNKQLEKSINALNADAEQNIDIFYGKHTLAELQLNGFEARLNRSNVHNILPVLKTLDEFYALKKLRYLCEAVNRKVSLSFADDSHEQHVSTLLKILQPYTNPKYPYVYLFVNVYQMLAATTYEESEIYYGLIKQYVTEHQKDKPVSQSIIEAVTYAHGNCIKWYNKGLAAAGNEFLWWIEWERQHDLLLENGRLQPINFRNIIVMALQHRSPQEIKAFIVHYSPFLPAEYRDACTTFALGLYQYRIKQHSKAARSFAAAQAGTDVVFNCIVRRWQWMNLYESNPTDVGILLSQLEAFNKFQLRHKAQVKQVQSAFKLFISYAEQLLRADALETELLRLKAEPHFAGKPWLLEQLQLKVDVQTRSKEKLTE